MSDIAKTAAIYRRISTTGQEDNTSLEGQLDACRKYAQQHNYNIVADFQDVVSGETLNRAGFRQLEALIEDRGVSAVIVYHQDRLSRNLIDTLLLIQKFANLGIELHDTTQGEIRDSLLSTITAVLSAEEKKTIRRRMQKGLRDKVQKGKITGQGDKAPYGYRYEGQRDTKQLVINENEARIVRQIYYWYTVEKLTLRGIVARLSEQRVPTPRDNGRKIVVSSGENVRGFGQWNFSTIAKMLCDTTYKGIVYYNRFIWRKREASGDKQARWLLAGERPENEWIGVPVPAIIDTAVWNAAQAQLQNAKQMAARNTKRFYLLRCRVKCSCGYAMNGSKHGSTKYYRCCGKLKSAAKPCTLPVVNADRLERQVWAWLQEEVTPDKLLAGLQHERAQSADRRATLLAQQSLLDQQITDLDAQLTRIKSAFVADVFTLEETAAEKGKVEMAKRSVEADLAQLRTKLADTGPSDEEADQLLAYAAERQSEMQHIQDDDKRRWLIDKLDIRVQLEIDQAGARWVSVKSNLALEGYLPLDHVMSII